MCQNEVNLALKNLPTWMKDEPVAKNLVSQLARSGAVPGGSSSTGLSPTLVPRRATDALGTSVSS